MGIWILLRDEDKNSGQVRRFAAGVNKGCKDTMWPGRLELQVNFGLQR